MKIKDTVQSPIVNRTCDLVAIKETSAETLGHQQLQSSDMPFAELSY